MDRQQKAAAIAEIAEDIRGADAVFAVDYRGISVPQAADVRTRLRDADARFRVVKNTLTERAADQAGAEALKALLTGPTALTFVHGDVALAAKAISGFHRETELLAFKGGLMDGEALEPAQLQAIARLPARDVLYGQLVGIVASPITGVVRGLAGLISGLAVALGQIQAKKESEAPAPVPSGDAGEGGDEPPPTDTPDQDAEAPEPAASPDEPAEGAPDATPDTDNA